MASGGRDGKRHFNGPSDMRLRTHDSRSRTVRSEISNGGLDLAMNRARMLVSTARTLWRRRTSAGGAWRQAAGCVEGSHQLGDVITISPGHDDRSRDPTGVYQQRSLASISFVGRWGWARLTAVPTVPSVMPRRSFAIARQYLPSPRARRVPPARAPKRSQLAPIPETACGSR
jgi:hypothetical protein